MAFLGPLMLICLLGVGFSSVQSQDNSLSTDAPPEETTAIEVVTRDSFWDSEALIADPIGFRKKLGLPFGPVCLYYVYYNSPLTIDEIGCLCYIYCYPLRPMTPYLERVRNEELNRRLNNQGGMVARIKSFMEALIMFLISGILGICGNIFLLVVIHKYMGKKSNTNVLLSSLAVSDLLITSICAPMKMFGVINNNWMNTSFGKLFACHLMWYLYYFSFTCSILTMTAMALERYIVLCYPMKAASLSSTSRIRKVAAFIWILAAVFTLPCIPVTGIPAGSTCSMKRMDQPTLIRVFYFYELVALFIIPLSIMTYSYTRISITLMKSIKVSKSLQNKGDNKDGTKTEGEDIKGRVQVIRMLIVVLVVFAILWGPLMIFAILREYYDHVSVDYYTDGKINYLFSSLSFLSSSVNPILLPLTSKQFRLGYRRAFSICCGPPLSDKEMTSRVTSTSNVVSKTQDSSAKF